MKHFCKVLGVSAASLLLPLLVGCSTQMATTTTTTTTTTPPPPVESNNCTTADVTSPAQPTPVGNYAGSAFSGTVFAGSLPMVGASVQVYAAGAAGNGSTPTPLLTTPLLTNASGAFSVPSAFTCPYNDSVLYAVASGGHAGAAGSSNAGAVLAAVLGDCDALAGSPTVTVNEATTVATASAMAQFLAPGGKIGAASTNSLGINLAAATAANLVDVSTGVAPGAGFPATGVAPTARLDSLANLLDACIVSSGASSTACAQLYADTATASVTPSNTLDAMLNLVKNPAANVASLYALSTASAAFSPALSAAPADWTLFATYTGGGMNDPSSIGIDSVGNIWVVNYFGVASLFSNTGVPAFATGVTGDNLENSYGGAVDVNDVAWIANEQSTYSINAGLGSVTLLNKTGASPANYGSGGLDFPISIAFDTSGTVWVVDYGNSHLTLLDNAGNPLSGSAGYTSGDLFFPVAVATDADCNGYVANQASNTITRVTPDGATFTNFATGSGASGLAVDAANNVWVANYYGDSVGLLSSTGTVLSGNGFTGGGITQPEGVAIDGAGAVWIANYRSQGSAGASITELAGASATTPGAALSPATGFGTDADMVENFGIAIDPAGNLWVSNFGSNTLTEFVGMAAPVKTPLLGPVRTP